MEVIPQNRQFCINRVHICGHEFQMYSVLNPWGEDDPIVQQLREGKFDEPESVKFWCFLASRANVGDIALDIGAYAGLYSLCAASVNSQLKIAALEPSAVTFGRLVDNIILNSIETRICAAHLAAWISAEQLELQHRYGIYSLCPGETIEKVSNVDHCEKVFAINIDSINDQPTSELGALASRSLGVSGFKRITAIKIDVEGAELSVLSGSVQTIRSHQPSIICEVLTDEALMKVKEFAKECDYAVERIGAERNYLLCPDHQRSELYESYAEWWAQNRKNNRFYATRRVTFEL